MTDIDKLLTFGQEFIFEHLFGQMDPADIGRMSRASKQWRENAIRYFVIKTCLPDSVRFHGPTVMAAIGEAVRLGEIDVNYGSARAELFRRPGQAWQMKDVPLIVLRSMVTPYGPESFIRVSFHSIRLDPVADSVPVYFMYQWLRYAESLQAQSAALQDKAQSAADPARDPFAWARMLPYHDMVSWTEYWRPKASQNIFTTGHCFLNVKSFLIFVGAATWELNGFQLFCACIREVVGNYPRHELHSKLQNGLTYFGPQFVGLVADAITISGLHPRWAMEVIKSFELRLDSHMPVWASAVSSCYFGPDEVSEEEWMQVLYNVT